MRKVRGGNDRCLETSHHLVLQTKRTPGHAHLCFTHIHIVEYYMNKHFK